MPRGQRLEPWLAAGLVLAAIIVALLSVQGITGSPDRSTAPIQSYTRIGHGHERPRLARIEKAAAGAPIRPFVGRDGSPKVGAPIRAEVDEPDVAGGEACQICWKYR